MSARQKLFLSILGAVLAHGVLYGGMATYLTVAESLTPPPKPPEPEEVTIFLEDILPPDLKEKFEKQYARTDPTRQADRKPENARFESDNDTLAASELPPDPTLDQTPDLPTTRSDKDLPMIEVQEREFRDGEFENTALPASQPAPLAVATPMVIPKLQPPQPQKEEERPETENPDHPAPGELEKFTPQEQSLDEPDLLAPPEMPPINIDPAIAGQLPPETQKSDGLVGREAPPTPERQPAEVAMPATTPPVQPSQPSPDLSPSTLPPSEKEAFIPETSVNKMNGSISNRGEASLDVENTPIGQYKKLVAQAIERQWHRYRQDNGAGVSYGSLRMRFNVDKGGTPRNLKVVRNRANSVVTGFSLKAVLDADIPPMPEEIANIFDGSGLEITYDIIIY